MKAACAVTPIILIAVAGFIFPRVWFWISWEILGGLLVAIGCIGEWVLLSKREDAHHRWLEKKFAVAVAIGVTMDVIGLSHAIPEAIRLENKASNAWKMAGEANERASLNESNNLIAQSNLAALQLKVQWRTISDEQEATLIRLLKPFNQSQKSRTNEIRVIADITDSESVWYAQRISRVLQKCGFDNGGGSGIILQMQGHDAKQPIPTGLFWGGNNAAHVPDCATVMLRAFKAANIPLNKMGLVVGGFPKMNENVLFLEIEHKPEQ